MTDYTTKSVDEQVSIITAELAHHATLQQAADLWDAAYQWIDEAKAKLGTAWQKVADVWPDGAGTTLGSEITEGETILGFWENAIVNSRVRESLKDLPQLVNTTYQNVMQLAKQYDKQNPGIKDLLVAIQIGGHLNNLAAAYQTAAGAMRQALPGNLPWRGPRKALDETGAGGDQNGPSSSEPGTRGSAKNPSSPSSTPDSKQDPGNTHQPDNQDSAKDRLDEDTKAVDALSQAAQSLRQLLGGPGSEESGLSSTAGDFNPADLASMSPSDFTNYLNHLANGSGMPALAGLDGGGGVGGVGGVGGIGSGIAAAPSPSSAPTSGTAAGQTSLPSTPLSTAGTAATGSSMMPPMYPQRGAGARASSGIKPGDAEDINTGRTRERKSSSTPGVALRGRAGKGRKARPSPATVRRPDIENDTGGLLDEELWQVNKEGNQPRRGTWPQQK